MSKLRPCRSGMIEFSLTGLLILSITGCGNTPEPIPSPSNEAAKPEVIKGAPAGPEMDHLLSPASKAAAQKQRGTTQKNGASAKP